MRNYENMENTLKIKVFLKSILFCKYLHNGSSDPYEIFYGGQSLSLSIKFHENPCLNAVAPVVNMRAYVLSLVRRFTPRTRAFLHGSSWNLILKLRRSKIVVHHHIKFHKDPSFRGGDICKAILTFWKL